MGVPISSLPAASALTGAELFPVVQSGQTKRTTTDAIPYVPAGTGAVATTVQAQLRKYDAGASAQNLLDMTNIACWGDSLTEGSGGTPYPSQLSTASGYKTYNGGVGGNTSTQIKTRFLAAPNQWSKLTIIWAGRNNYSDGATVLADVAAMVAAIGHDGYLVMSVLNGSYGGYEIPGGVGYNQIIAINNSLAATYGSNYLDIRKILVDSYNPALPQDVIDHNNDTPPTSLRSDAIHLNTAGYAAVAAAIRANIAKLRGNRGVPVSSAGVTDLFGSPPGIGNVTRNEGRFTILLADFFQLAGKNVSISGDGTAFQFAANFNPSADATYDIGTAYKWRDLSITRNASIPGTATVGQVQTLVVEKLVDAGASVDLFRTSGTYNGVLAATMVVRSRKTVGAGLTLSNFSVSMIGSGTAGGVSQTSTEDYGAGSATFTLTETRDSPTGGQNKVTFNNTSGSQVAVSVILTVYLGAAVAL